MQMIRFFLVLCTLASASTHARESLFSIMLDPAGDAKHTGRKLDDSFERGITLQFAEQLKKVLEQQHGNTVQVVLTRFPGETLQPLQNANFANRLNVDLYLNIHFYQDDRTKPQLFLYRFSHGNEFVTKLFDLHFYAYDLIHMVNKEATKRYAHSIKQTLTSPSYAQQFEVLGLFSLPFKPLIGIKAPALALEASLHHKDDWRTFVEPIAQSLAPLIEGSK